MVLFANVVGSQHRAQGFFTLTPNALGVALSVVRGARAPQG